MWLKGLGLVTARSGNTITRWGESLLVSEERDVIAKQAIKARLGREGCYCQTSKHKISRRKALMVTQKTSYEQFILRTKIGHRQPGKCSPGRSGLGLEHKENGHKDTHIRKSIYIQTLVHEH